MLSLRFLNFLYLSNLIIFTGIHGRHYLLFFTVCTSNTFQISSELVGTKRSTQRRHVVVNHLPLA